MSLYINEMHILDMRFAANVSVAEFEQWLARIQHYFEHKQNFVLIMQTDVNTEFPEELKDTYPQMVSKIMQEAAAKYYHKLPIPAVPEVDTCWRH